VLLNSLLVAVASKSTDGTAGLQSDDGFAALRQEIERFAHIIFSGTAKTRDFWLGKEARTPEEIEKYYRFLKPCIHGSDAHDTTSVAKPAQDRFTWLKGMVSFETLRQAVIEPEDRVWIGPTPPKFGIESQSLAAVSVSRAEWLTNERIGLNPGLVAIIGARGSGKTALVDVIAAGTRGLSGHLTHSSFLKRASEPIDHVEDARATIFWRDGSSGEGALDPREHLSEQDEPEIRYLSQQFVDRLCSSAGLAVELRQELERVVFEAIDPINRLNAEDFSELATKVLQPIRLRQSALRDRIEALSARIGEEEILRHRLPGLKQRHQTAVEQLTKLRKEVEGLVPKGQEERARRLAVVEAAHQRKQQEIAALHQRQKCLADLLDHVDDVTKSREPQRWEAMRSTFFGTGLSADDWKAFQMVFVGDAGGVVRARRSALEMDVDVATKASPLLDLTTMAVDRWPLESLALAVETARKEVGVDAQQQRRYAELSRKTTQDEASIAKLTAEIAHAESGNERRDVVLADRRAAYIDVFRALAQEESALRDLYKPLEAELEDSSGALAKLKLVVNRNVDLASWAIRGETFIDLRLADKLRGKGTLLKEAESIFYKAWTKGTPEDVGEAMDAFRSAFNSALIASIPKTLPIGERAATIQAISKWLYDTNHIRVEYGIEFDGVAIEQLSPGTRGIVLLLLYLALDKRDTRPLIVDQPEENLDPQSVYDELVPHFRSARKRRQVILVTHNANLVVNTDADQVIVASAHRSNADGLPDITYTGGALEQHEIRQAVCNILEGGHRAFLERERRYRFRWDDMVESVPGLP